MVFTGVGAALEERDVPQFVAGPGEVRLQVRACGVCRTDLHVVDGELAEPKLPLVPGHEIVGTVVETSGAGVDALRGRRARRRAVARLHLRRLPLLPSAAARISATAPRFTGYTRDGGYAEYAVADERFCFPLPDGLRRSSRPRRCSAPA